jgi:hypothetical protein
MEMVTLQTQERFILLQQVVRNRPMRVVADRAVFYHRRVLKGKRTLFIRMAFPAKIVDPLFRLQVVQAAPMVFMAV